jgi:predicted DNA-binding transcriptional regulator AlpA
MKYDESAPGTVAAARLIASPRRGLRREEAALYIGVGASKFDQLVRDGRMPKPVHIDGCVVWDLRKLDTAFDALMDRDDRNPWDAANPLDVALKLTRPTRM